MLRIALTKCKLWFGLVQLVLTILVSSGAADAQASSFVCEPQIVARD